ncbi:plasmid mobilization protein [Stutzerimonas kunmingensis]|uniref:Uncharacterized protein n=1 Tax=Stutzerimonas kunmingensis TaxID=1211807 RepID=A0A9X1SPM5_9GAMM|nr:hypothetical protein [Stutzerimonas kunmingensis]MCD1608649.1 hypothetical protein [Stutzerimonas kunmingensis]
MKNIEKEKRDGTFIVRVSAAEREVIDAKVDEAGYKSVSAYVRDYIAREKPKAKIEASARIVQIELNRLALMIQKQEPKEALLAQIRRICTATLGGAI